MLLSRDIDDHLAGLKKIMEKDVPFFKDLAKD